MKKCPYCAEQIQDEAIKCRYCGSMLTQAVPPPATSAPGGGAPFDDEARQLAAAGRKIEAIKLVRERTHAGLAEAKAYVEALEAGRTPRFPNPAAAGATPRATIPGTSRLSLGTVLLLIALALAAVLIYRQLTL